MTSKAAQIPSTLAAYRKLYRAAAKHVAPHGAVVAACCTSRIDRGLFKRTVNEALGPGFCARARPIPPRAGPSGRLRAGRLPEGQHLAPPLARCRRWAYAKSRPLFLGGGFILFGLGAAIGGCRSPDRCRARSARRPSPRFQLMTHYANDYFRLRGRSLRERDADAVVGRPRACSRTTSCPAAGPVLIDAATNKRTLGAARYYAAKTRSRPRVAIAIACSPGSSADVRRHRSGRLPTFGARVRGARRDDLRTYVRGRTSALVACSSSRSSRDPRRRPRATKPQLSAARPPLAKL